MRSRSGKLTGLPTTVLVLGAGLFALAPSAPASPVVNYSTSGTIDSAGVSGTPVISFNSVLNSSFESPSSFSLGDFQVAALPDGQTTTYNDTQFHITYLANTVDGKKPDPNQTPIQVSGVLNGQVTGGNQSHVVAKFDPISKADFATGAFNNTISITDNPLTLVPSTTNNGQTSAQAFLTSSQATTPPPSSSGGDGGTTTPTPSGSGGDTPQVPEPSTIALFLTALAGFGVQRARRPRTA